jgi:hypothetical protein
MSFGGVLGGVFASLVAPAIFSAVYEYPILLAATFLCRPELWRQLKMPRLKIFWTFGVALLLVALPALVSLPHWTTAPEYTRFGMALAVLTIFFTRASLITQMGAVICGFVIVNGYGLNQLAIERARSFYGTHTVMAVNDDGFHLLIHGTTIHGAQKWSGKSEPPQGRPRPSSYYFPNGAIGTAVEIARAHNGLGRVGVVGLGSGASACLGRSNEFWRFFEIDPEVTRLARDRSRFSYLSDCETPHDIILGDGRRMLGNETDASLDLLVLDAFSSDSIPVHLLTAEAIRLYLTKLKPGGVIVIHISNKYMKFGPAVAAAALSQGLIPLVSVPDPGRWPTNAKDQEALAEVAVLVRSEADAAPYFADGRFTRLDPKRLPETWTDDYSNTLDAMWRKLSGT